MQLLPFDDGHIPENLRDVPAQIADCPLFRRDRNPQVHVFGNALPEPLVDLAYEKTANSGLPAWGDYVTLEQVKTFWAERGGYANKDDFQPSKTSDVTVALAAYFLKLSLGETDKAKPFKQFSLPGQPGLESIWNRTDAEDLAHGIAVWGLAALVGSQVMYHLDYAEQIRYESNVIVPPLVAGTLHCTRAKIKGGDFVVSLDGITHYDKHGYKCKRSQPDIENMIRIPYQFNQLTCHLGNLPHASTRIESIDGPQVRVIVGFNVFGHDVGHKVQEAPEHSEKFRRKVQAQRAILRSNAKIMSIERLRQNKPLTKLIVLAKRERIKQEFKQAQERLAQEIPKHLPATVEQLMNRFYSRNQEQCWPATPTDVQVYLHHQIKRGNFKVIPSPESRMMTDLVSPQATLVLPNDAINYKT